jgi:hypothetical protein
MRIVGVAAGITIYAPSDAYFSYFNSPYVGHSLGTAIDIYPIQQEWGGPVLSPVSGIVVKIRKLHMGKTKSFPTDDFDYGLGIQPENTKKDIVRVMHCKPVVREGESVDLGDQIGHTIRSRYFNYWTGPHYHVEILPPDSFSRSTKSYPLDIRIGKKLHHAGHFSSSMEVLISDVSDDRAIGYSKQSSRTSIGNITGLSAHNQSGSATGVIDGGLSHYEHGGIIGKQDINEHESVYFGSHSVGTITYSRNGVSRFQRGPSIKASFNEHELRGLSCFLFPPQYTKNGTPQIILIPREYRGFRNLIENGNVGILEISSCSELRV